MYVCTYISIFICIYICTSVRGLELLVDEALSYLWVSPYATSVCGLKLLLCVLREEEQSFADASILTASSVTILVCEALSYQCMKAYATSV
jgi:hypothetical protein